LIQICRNLLPRSWVAQALVVTLVI